MTHEQFHNLNQVSKRQKKESHLLTKLRTVLYILCKCHCFLWFRQLIRYSFSQSEFDKSVKPSLLAYCSTAVQNLKDVTVF